jgi:dethiobiotin synthetase
LSIFITGTDTGAGKTYVSALLIRALRRHGINAVGMKPICCGDRTDAETLHAASDGVAPLNTINPVWLRAPAAPYAASLIENRSIDLDLIRESFETLRTAHPVVVVEGVGGWLVPITAGYFVRDLARELALPVIVVTGNRLGALNHTLLTVEAIRTAGVSCSGIILNETSPRDPADIAAATNRAILESLADVPLLLEIEHGQQEIALSGRLEELLTR